MIRRNFWLPLEQAGTRRLAHVRGLEHVPVGKPFIVASNHIDWLDGIILLLALDKKIPRVPIRYLARAKNYEVLGSYSIPIDPKNQQRAMQTAARHLRNNGIIGFFPEGRRNPEEQLLAGKTGCVRLALQTGAPILPVGLRGPSHRSFLSAVFALPRLLRETHVEIGEPVLLPVMADQDITYAILQQQTRAIMHRIAQLSGKKEPDYATHP